MRALSDGGGDSRRNCIDGTLTWGSLPHMEVSDRQREYERLVAIRHEAERALADATVAERPAKLRVLSDAVDAVQRFRDASR
jgi:hypothetical protein